MSAVGPHAKAGISTCSLRLLLRAAMISQKILFVSLLLGLSLIVSSVFAEQPSTAEHSFVLLRNGNVLKGLVRSEKDRISIAEGGNSIVSVETKQVSFIGTNLESLYQHQRSKVRNWGTGEHWQLAHWCIQQGLVDHAIQHYKVLEESASDSPRFKQLEHLLREAMLADETVKQAVQRQSQASAPKTSNNEFNSQASAVVKANAETPILKSVPNAESSESWNKNEIPGYIRKTFHKDILPVLVSRCGQSGCHGMLGKSDFHIYLPSGDQSASILTRDLDEVLRYIDRDRFQDSPLLAYATKSHGLQRNPSLNQSRDDDRKLIERINFWVKSLAFSQRAETTMPAQYPMNPPVAPSVTSAVANVPVAKSSARNSKLTDEVEKDRNAKLSKPAKSAPPTEFISISEIAELESMIEKFERQLGSGANGSAAKKDPFDPDVFNRQFR